MADKKLTYNDIALRLNRLQTKLDNYNAPLDAENQRRDKKLQAMLLERHNLERQLQDALPSTKYSLKEAEQAVADSNSATDQITQLQQQGVPDSDPRIQDLSTKLKQARQIVEDFRNDPNQPDKIKAQAEAYVKNQNAQLKQKETETTKQNQLQSQINKLQKQRDDAFVLGKDTSSLDQQLGTLKQQLTGVTTPPPSGSTTTPLTGTAAMAAPGPSEVRAGVTTPATKPLGGAGGTGGGGAGGAGSTGSKGKKTPPPPSTPTLTPDEIRQEAATKYGAQLALINSDTGLSQLLNQAIKENWSKEQWAAAYQNSNWFQTHQANIRDYETKRLSDPGAFAEQYNKILRSVQETGTQLGIDTSGFGSEITPDQAKTINPNSLMGQLFSQYPNGQVDATYLRNFISSHGIINRTGGVTGGEIATNANALRDYARSMGINTQLITPTWKGADVKPGTNYFEAAAQAISSGQTTLEAEKNYYKSVAAATYKPYAKEINDGITVQSLAYPYANTISNLMDGLDPASFEIGAPTGYGQLISQAMQGDGTNPMTVDAFTTMFKQRPEWLNTSNARNSVMDTAYNLLRNFGAVVG